MQAACDGLTKIEELYAPSGDSFYPVELNGSVYDSFALRVVFERDKTGFEESKEFPIRTNMVVAARYQIIEYLGSAAFSRAVQCLDLDTNKMVCMKIIKNDKDFFDQSLDEIKLLKYINVNGDVDYNNVLRLYDHFYHKEHLIIVTELLRDNLYEFSKFNRECGDEPYFTIGRLQKISRQILTALDYVHSLRLIHCDLKPENILIKSYSRCEVKVIDFGSSCFIDDHLSSYVQSRSYRAPEVMLGLPYDQKIDLWSLGCILAELWTGYVLFQNDSVQSLLARILGIIGEFPYHMMTSGKYVPQYFTQDGQLYQEIEGAPCPERGRRLHLLVPKKTSLRQRMRTNDELLLDFLEKLLQLDPAQRPTAAEAMEHPFLAPGRIPDFTEDAEMLSWAGVGLGEAESYKVMCSMRNLAANQKDGLNKLRFWGKIFGTEADYYVAEAQKDGGEPDETDPDAEPPGQGANQFTYYVTNDLAGDWRRLPDIKPKEIIAARAIKRLVTGNAGSKVITHPAFEGAEEVYLRAQIARITADTVICMKGYLKKEEEEGSPIEQNEEFICPPAAELLKMEAWTHMQPHILRNGRTTHKEIPEGDTPEELELAAKMKEEQEADPEKEVLRGLHADGLQWTIKQAGDATVYRASADPAAPLRSSAVTYVRSLSWPGAVTAVRNGQFVSIYVGYGLAASSPNFFPPAPPDVQEEPEDPGEVEEPQGSLEEPKEPEE
ncbi:dyrk2 [Symbiodinium necroappetens]|uniref:Dyrk2 protein n=1 Tax=Symbiodinium necroappetens TaxID=1628268 RepID=A0A812QF14_9DINO|nr:dyrk2 [Symbiodinium necroappetens]